LKKLRGCGWACRSPGLRSYCLGAELAEARGYEVTKLWGYEDLGLWSYDHHDVTSVTTITTSRPYHKSLYFL